MAEELPARVAKSELRSRMLAVRRRIPPDVRARASRQASRNLLGIPEVADASVALLYAATPAEADPDLAARRLRAQGVRVLLPRVAGDGLEAIGGDGDAALTTSPLGVPEPAGPAVPVDTIDVVVVPAVAYDHRGGRLGRGGGHYDRLLDELPAATVRIGLCFAAQLVGEVPREDHDRGVHVVVTEEGVVRVTDG